MASPFQTSIWAIWNSSIQRIAQRTVEQRRIFVNNPAIRRAVEELKRAKDYAQVCHILQSAFRSNDFDGFELKVDAESQPAISAETHAGGSTGTMLHFEKLHNTKIRNGWSAWHLTQELVTSDNRWLGSMKMYRFYTDRALLVDTNLLTGLFPVVLADALDRALIPKPGVVSDVTADADFLASEAS